jgi:hypothetical protein
MPVEIVMDDLKPSIAAGALAVAAKEELGAFLFAVEEVFGVRQVLRASDLWITNLERADWDLDDAERSFRQITLLTSAQLAGAEFKNDT